MGVPLNLSHIIIIQDENSGYPLNHSYIIIWEGIQWYFHYFSCVYRGAACDSVILFQPLRTENFAKLN